jgi:hypothetical protein
MTPYQPAELLCTVRMTPYQPAELEFTVSYAAVQSPVVDV